MSLRNALAKSVVAGIVVAIIGIIIGGFAEYYFYTHASTKTVTSASTVSSVPTVTVLATMTKD